MFSYPPSILCREILGGPPAEIPRETAPHLLPLCTFCGHSHLRHPHGSCDVEGCSCAGFRAPECELCDHQRIDHPLIDRHEGGATWQEHGPCGVAECGCRGFRRVNHT